MRGPGAHGIQRHDEPEVKRRERGDERGKGGGLEERKGGVARVAPGVGDPSGSGSL